MLSLPRRLLPPRLQVAAELVTPGARFADIGCHHALLSIHIANAGLATAGLATKVVAIDRSEASLEDAHANIARHLLPGRKVETRCGDGLKPLAHGECNEITMCGLGISRMIQILAGDLQGVHTFVLQPVAPRVPQLFELRTQLWLRGYCKQGALFSRPGPLLPDSASRAFGSRSLSRCATVRGNSPIGRAGFAQSPCPWLFLVLPR